MDREKYRRMFIEEARESLRTFTNELVSLEKLLASTTPPSEKDQARARDVMDAAFRTAHSLKGMGAAMGYVRFADLAHGIEDLADVARQGRAIGAAGFDLLIEGSDKLEEMVEKVAAGDENPDAGDLLARVHEAVLQLRASMVPTPAPASTDAMMPSTSSTSSTSSTVPSSAVASGTQSPVSARGLVAVRVRIADDASLPQVRAFVVHKALAVLPGYRVTEPAADSLRTTPLPGRILTVRFDPAQGDFDVDNVERVARGQQGVAEVSVVRDDIAPVIVEEPASAPSPSTGEDDRTVRVRTALLDDLLDSVGELLLARSRIRALAGKMDLPDLADLVDEVERLTRDLHGRVVAARMTPLGFIAERFPRVVRDLAKASKKSVDFSMQGTEIELDRAILDELSAPFLHMLRNAVDHAHEGPDARKAAGKASAMKLVLRASRERDTVLLELVDDGGGMDAMRIKKRAVERGLVTQTAANALTESQALELICLPGFSTAEQVSQTSGRGVGMDVVKATLERLGGSLRIESAPGQGTQMTLQLPLTVAIIQVLVVEAGVTAGARDAYAIPVTRVEQAIDLDAAGISVAHGRTFMKHGDGLVPLFDLSQALGYDAAPGRAGTVIVVGRGKDMAGLRVDAILGQEEVVAKPLGPPLSAFGYLAGATLLADGRAAFILEPVRLVQAAAGAG